MSRFPEGEWRLVEQGDANEFVILSDNNRWVVAFRQNGEMHVAEQRALGLLMAASKDMYAALDAADTAFAVLNVQDLGSQARACVRQTWPLVQDALVKANPGTSYAEAVKEAQQHEIARLDALVADLYAALENAVRCGERDGVPGNPGSAPEWVAKSRAVLDKTLGVARDQA